MNQQSERAQRFEATAESWVPGAWTSEQGPAMVRAIDDVAKEDRLPGQRAAHKHGFLLSGFFEPTEVKHVRREFRRLSDFQGLTRGRYQAVARFSNLTKPLDCPDIMGMATKIVLESGETTDFVAMSADVFPVAHSSDFAKLLEVQKQPPLRRVLGIAALVATRRISGRALAAMWRARKIDHGNGSTTLFHGIQTFRLVASACGDRPGRSTPMRYSWIPDINNRGGPSSIRPSEDRSVIFHLEMSVVPIGSPLSPRSRRRLDDPRYRWKNARSARVGTLTLNEAVDEPPNLGFNPTHLAPGIAVGPDEIFSARQGAYAVSRARRITEP